MKTRSGWELRNSCAAAKCVREFGWGSLKVDSRQHSDPRRLAATVLNRVIRNGSYADIVLDAALDRGTLEAPDRALATELVYGTLRWLKRLDWTIDNLYRGKSGRMPTNVRRIAEVGLYQILFLEKVPSYAAVNEAVEAAKEASGRYWSGVINAVLRNAIRNPDATFPNVPNDDPVSAISIQWSHPTWLVRKWVERFGMERTVSICASNNAVPATALRINPMRTDREGLRKALEREGIAAADSTWLEGYLVLSRPGRATESTLFRKGLFSIQDQSAGFVTRLLDPRPGETILDMTAAPGGKSMAIAEETRDRSTVVSADRYRKRVVQIDENRRRLGIRRVHPVMADTVLPLVKPVDKVLLDAPCSGMGIVRRHPEIKWNRSVDRLAGLVALQEKLLNRAAEAVKPGGVLVY
ncbi:MAG TPA: 16S rRNA (cytosine(967)-C(5))-methyltransferase RsmB, partial [bacterium]